MVDNQFSFLNQSKNLNVNEYKSQEVYISMLIQFNSKTLVKDGDPVSLQLILPGAIQTCAHSLLANKNIS